MNRYLVNSLIFIAGAACGSGLTYAILRSKIQKKADEEIEEMRKYVERKVRPYENAEKMSEKLDEAAISEIFDEEESQFTDYVRFYNPDEDGNDEGIVKIEVESVEPDAKRELRDTPYIISDDEFIDIVPNYDKITLSYWPNGRVLTDEMHDQREDLSVVGEENLDIFDQNDDSIMYIRNDRLGIDYEIEKIYED